MVWLWTIISLLILFVNSFAIGKLYKRFNYYLNSYLQIILGCITYIGGFILIFTIILLFNINFTTILYISLVYQIILCIIYVFNWRYFFISYRINLKQILVILFFIILCVIFYLITRNYTSENINWYFNGSGEFKQYYEMKFLNKNPNDIIITEFGSNTLVDGFNVINIIYAIIIYLFKIDINQIQLFFSLFNISLFIFLLSLIAQVTFFKINQGGKFWIKIVLAVLFLTISNIASWWLNQYAWVILSTILLVSLHMAKQNEISSKILIYAINFCVLFGVAFDILFIISATVVNILQLFLSYKSRKENATEYNIMMCFSNLLVGANVFDNTNYASFILILIIISSYVLYLFYKSSNIAKKVNNKLDEFFYKWINLIIIICIIIVVLVSIGLFFSNENKKIYLDPWLIVNLESNNQLWFYLINIWFWIFNILFFVYSLFKNSIFRFKFLNRFFDYPEVDGAILGVFSFWNPIVLNIFKVLADQNILSISVDLKVIFFAVFTPLLLAINKKMSLSNKISISNYILISGVVASSALIIASINMGVVV